MSSNSRAIGWSAHPLWYGLPGVLAGWVLGVALQLQQASLWPWPVYTVWMALVWPLGVLFLSRPVRRPRLALAAAALTAALAGFGLTGLRAVHMARDGLPASLEGVNLVVVGRVASLPQRGSESDRFVFEVDTAQRESTAVRLPTRLQLSDFHGPRPGRDWRAGDRWQLTVRLRRPHGNANPHGFDRERWLWEQGIGATGYVRNGRNDAPARHLGASGLHPVASARQWVAQRIRSQVADARSAGVLAGLVVGDQSAIEHDDWALFRQTGVAHLMAISGLHITLFAWLASAVLGRLWRLAGRRWPPLLWRVPVPLAAGWGGVALAGAYAVFSGGGVPAQRTVLMLALVVGLRLSVRVWPWPLVWALAMAAVLALDPWALWQPGFWLSFVAVGILFASAGPASLVLSDDAPTPRWRRALGPLVRMLREQGVMTVSLAPLSLVLFGQLSLAGLLANLVAIPWVTLLVTPLALLGVLWAPLWDLAALAVQVLVQGLGWLAQWPLASVFRPIAPWPLALLGVAGGVWMVLRLPWTLRLAGLLMVLPMLLWSPERPAPGQFEVMAIDVGQGSAVLVRTAQHSLLYDTGPRFGPDSDAGERIVVPLLHALGEQPQTVVVSHQDGDHAGGAAAVRAAWPQARWLASFGEGEPCVAGQQWDWDGVHFEVLHPSPEHYRADGQGTLSSNAMSCVLRVDNGERSAWLSGDLDAHWETRLALARPGLRATLMLAPHHGSASSSSPVLLNTLRPSLVLVQSGYRNRFGHPSSTVLTRYRERALRWIGSPSCGAGVWRSDDSDQLWCQREAFKRYWHHGGASLMGDFGPDDPASESPAGSGDG